MDVPLLMHHYNRKIVIQSNYELESRSFKIATLDAVIVSDRSLESTLIFRISRKLSSSKRVKLISASWYPLIVVEAINILERCGGQLGWKIVVQSDRERTSWLEHWIRLRTFVLVLVIISYLRMRCS